MGDACCGHDDQVLRVAAVPGAHSERHLATAILAAAAAAADVPALIETSDVALIGEDLRHLPKVLEHPRRSRRIMLQNIGLSLATITALMPSAPPPQRARVEAA